MFRSAATKLAHNTTVPGLGGNKDLRPLQDLITAEKQVLVSLQKLSADFAKASDALRVWGSGEGDDLGDILGSSTELLTLYSAAVAHYASLGHTMRDQLKSIRSREENLDELKRRRKSLASKADSADKKLNKMDSAHKNYQGQVDMLNALRAEIRSMDSEIMSEEAYLGDFKRATTKSWMTLKFGGMLECSEKGTIAGEYGKLIVAEILEEQTQPGMARSLYYGRPRVESLLNEAHRCINEVRVATAQPEGTSAPGSSTPLPPRSLNQLNNASSTGATEWSHAPSQGEFLPPTWNSNGQFMSPNPSFQPGSPEQFGHLQQQYTGASGTGSGNPSLVLPIQQAHPHDSSTFSSSIYDTNPTSARLQTPTTARQPQPGVDDFGFMPPNSAVSASTTNNISSPVDQPASGRSGRFATFPVKNRPQGVVGPGAPDTQDDSFSSSVMEALRSSQSPPGTQPQFEGQPGFGQALGAGGVGGGGYQSFAPPGGPPPGWTGGLPPGAAQPQAYHDHPHGPGGEHQQEPGQEGSHSRDGAGAGTSEHLDEDVTLAYMHDPSDEARAWRERQQVQMHQHQHQQYGPGQGQEQGLSDQGTVVPPNPRVRFSEEGPVEYSPALGQSPHSSIGGGAGTSEHQEVEHSAPPHQHVLGKGPEQHVHDQWGAEGAEHDLRKYPSGPPQYEELGPEYHLGIVSEHDSSPTTALANTRNEASSPAYANQKRIPVPRMDSPAPMPEDETARNAAAAYEVGREMQGQGQGLAGSSAPQPQARSASPDQYQDDETEAPLSPPFAPFAHRGPSPRPGPDYEAPVGVGEYYASGTRNAHPSPLTPAVPRIATGVPSSISLDDARGRSPGGLAGAGGRFSPASLHSNSAYATPSEYPSTTRSLGSGLGQPGMLTSMKSSSSLASIPSGAKTISAAAFRKPQRVASASGELPPVDTSPLALKKRLPASPYPAQRTGTGERDGSPRPSARSGYPGGSNYAAGGRDGSPNPGSLRGRGSRENSPRPSLSERKRSGSIPRAPEGLPPSGALPPIPTSQGEEYDYLGAYVHSGATTVPEGYVPRMQQQQQYQGYRQGGYGNGRYATNLEDGIR